MIFVLRALRASVVNVFLVALAGYTVAVATVAGRDAGATEVMVTFPALGAPGQSG